jgi:tetratricopeptide (TPR) repeat protein
LSKQPVPPEEKNPAVSPKLSAVIMTCLEKDKAKRLASPASLGTQLRAIAVDDFGITVARPEAGPSDPNASFSVVDALIKLGDYSKARAICESQSQDSFWKRHFLAFITLREGDYSTAQKAFQNCLDQADSKVARTLALGGIGETCQKMGDLKQALGYFEQSTLEAPDQGVPLANTARVRGLLGDVQGAVAAYRKALGLAYDITFVLGLAEVLLQERMYDEAVEELSKALTMYADDVRLQHPLAEALSAKVLFYLNQHHLFLPGMTHEVQLAKSYALRSLEVGYLTERSSMLVRLCDRLLIVLRG